MSTRKHKTAAEGRRVQPGKYVILCHRECQWNAGLELLDFSPQAYNFLAELRHLPRSDDCRRNNHLVCFVK